MRIVSIILICINAYNNMFIEYIHTRNSTPNKINRKQGTKERTQRSCLVVERLKMEKNKHVFSKTKNKQSNTKRKINCWVADMFVSNMFPQNMFANWDAPRFLDQRLTWPGLCLPCRFEAGVYLATKAPKLSQEPSDNSWPSRKSFLVHLSR